MNDIKLGWRLFVTIGGIISLVPGCGVRNDLALIDAGPTTATGGVSANFEHNAGGSRSAGDAGIAGGYSQVASTASGGNTQSDSRATGGTFTGTSNGTGGVTTTGESSTRTESTATGGSHFGNNPATGGRSPVSDASVAPAAEVQASLMARWNQVVDSHPSDFDFHWVAFDQFMPPTFRGGSVEAYQAYAKVLLAFMQQSDNFDYLASRGLFDLDLRFVSDSDSVLWDSSFSDEVTMFASETSFGNIDADTRAGLEQIAERIAQSQ